MSRQNVNRNQFFAFFAYEPKSVANLASTKNHDYISHCGQTMVGWFHQHDNTKWGCFQAQKPGQSPWSPPQFKHQGKQGLEKDAIVSSFLETSLELEQDKHACVNSWHLFSDLFQEDHFFFSSSGLSLTSSSFTR